MKFSRLLLANLFRKKTRLALTISSFAIALLLFGFLAASFVARNGDLVGDPTEGALVVLAEKGRVDAVSTREAYPRIAELPFDAQ